MSERCLMFDIKRDNAIIEAGGFWCSACLGGKPAVERSPDQRYCRGCYDFLLKEAALEGRRSGDWRPTKRKRTSEPSTSSVLAIDNSVSSGNARCDMVTHGGLLGTQGVTTLVIDRIRLLASQGMSCRAIERELLKDNITVSYRTIARRLKGQGVMV